MEVKQKKSVHFATITIWAALMAAASMLPSFAVFGGGGSFSIGYTLAPLAGVLFGPFPGALAALIGDFIGTLIAPHTANVGIFTCLTGAANALAAGFMVRKRWWPALAMIAVGFANWMLYEAGRASTLYIITVWGIGAVMCLIGGIVGARLFEKDNYLLKAVGLFICIYPCYIAAQAINTLFVMVMYDLPLDLLKFLAVMVPLERLLFTLGAVIIGIPLLAGLPKIGVFVGPQYDNQTMRLTKEDEELKRQYEAQKQDASGNEKDDEHP